MVDGTHEFMQISISRREKVYHVIVWSYDQCSDHVTLDTEPPRIPHPLLWDRHKWIREPTRARGAIGKYLTNDDLVIHCGTGERQKYDDLSRHSGTQEVKHLHATLPASAPTIIYCFLNKVALPESIPSFQNILPFQLYAMLKESIPASQNLSRPPRIYLPS